MAKFGKSAGELRPGTNGERACERGEARTTQTTKTTSERIEGESGKEHGYQKLTRQQERTEEESGKEHEQQKQTGLQKQTGPQMRELREENADERGIT